MRPWLIAMLLLTALLAGCTEDPATLDDADDGPIGDQDGEDDSGDDGGGDGNATPEGNTAPVANLTADVLNGTAPLHVSLSLNGTDADGDNLTWVLLLSGDQTANGTALPAALNFTLEAGNHTFALTVSDGNLSATANLTITVAAATAEEPDPNAPVDMGSFVYDPATGMCHLKSYTGYGSGPAMVYNFDLWVFAETNGEPGLQVANNFLVGPAEGLGFADAAWDICEDGDQMLF